MAKKKYKWVDNTAMTLTAVGGLNWGLVTFDYNLVTWLANNTIPILEPIVYGAVGLSAVWLIGKWIMKKLS